MRSVKLTPPLIFLIFVNLVPLAGVFALGWDVVTLLVLYWLEGLIIGILNILKMLACEGGIGEKLFLIPFFTFHYGIFASAHGVFLKEMFGAELSWDMINGGSMLFWAALTFFVSHVISMIVNFIGKEEFKGRKVSDQMFKPYGRVIVMHMVVLVGGILVQVFGQPVFALIVLIFLKTGIDWAAHKASHALATDAP